MKRCPITGRFSKSRWTIASKLPGYYDTIFRLSDPEDRRDWLWCSITWGGPGEFMSVGGP